MEEEWIFIAYAHSGASFSFSFFFFLPLSRTGDILQANFNGGIKSLLASSAAENEHEKEEEWTKAFLSFFVFIAARSFLLLNSAGLESTYVVSMSSSPYIPSTVRSISGPHWNRTEIWDDGMAGLYVRTSRASIPALARRQERVNQPAGGWHGGQTPYLLICKERQTSAAGLRGRS